MMRGLLLIILLGTVQAALGFGQESRQKEIDSICAAAGLKAQDAPGGAVLVLERGRVVFERGYGLTDMRSRQKITPATNFRLASVTKQFTAMAVMLLVHDRKLSYDETLSGVFPDFPAYGKKITVRELLQHTSGLKDYEDLMPPANPNMPVEEIQIQDAGVLDLLKQQTETKFPSGTKWDYSNSGYVLLGLIVKKVSAKTFPAFLRERIFQPLGMSNTVAYVRGKNQVINRAFGHSRDRREWRETDQSPTSATLGDGGIYSSLEDMAKWDRALREHTLLSAQEMQAALTPVKVLDGKVTEPDGSPAAYGFGWFLNPYKGNRRMWHYGETMGFRTAIQRFEKNDLTIVVLCNRADLDPTALALRVADLMLR
ncbi:MAG TPA: serine hydrolase domain-containing protein [Candidatus Angelobacter sp.]|nr:serine hydrolase domain-containing protein [Candidatus Angelobacter sp.]